MPVVWRAVIDDGPSDLAADAEGVVVTSNASRSMSSTAGTCAVAGRAGRRRSRAARARSRPRRGGWPRLDHGAGARRRRRALDPTARPRRPTRSRWPARTALVGDDGGTLAAFDAATGGPRWSVAVPGRAWSGARVDRATRRGRRHLAPVRGAGGARVRPRHRCAPMAGTHRSVHRGARGARGPGRARDRRRQPPCACRGARPRHRRAPVADPGAGIVRGGDRARGRRPRRSRWSTTSGS